MKQIIDPRVTSYKLDLERIVRQKCKSQALCLLSAEQILKALNLSKNWNLVTCWLYVYGNQRYSGNKTTQNELSFVKIGLRRFLYNLGMGKINAQTAKPTNSEAKTNAWIEVKMFKNYLSQQNLSKELAALDKILHHLNYRAYIDVRPDGDEKIVWEPL